MHILDQYTLPYIDFVSGSTQELVFYCYYYANRKPFDLCQCSANFSMINYVNKNGAYALSKSMRILGTQEEDENASNVLAVTLEPSDTNDLEPGKYIYQITVKDENGNVDIPNQGIIHIIRNINRTFVQRL